ncbi:MAG TPA: alpha/beta fold hydrolase [Dehalococcoidia bacterium]|nr:alpha/beta fold hydrolase [Dehalococcoidia bacterium]
MSAPPVQYVTTSDGVRIAYAVSGEGRPLVLLPQLFSHIEVYWTQETFMLPWFQGLADRFRFIQYDGRNQGMSSRGHDVPGMENFVRDLEAVVEHLNLDPFLLVAADWHTHTAVRYAVAHPERVDGLVLFSGSVDNTVWPMALYQSFAAEDWESFLRSQVATGRSVDLSAGIQRLKAASEQADWLQLVGAAVKSDITELLPLVKAPTMVLHGRNFASLPPEASMRFASLIPDAGIVVMEGAQGMGIASEGLHAIDDFVARIPIRARSKFSLSNVMPDGLSQREAEVLRLLAVGKSNQQIADELVISLNTVNRHVSNIYAKIGAANRAEAAAYATRRGLA